MTTLNISATYVPTPDPVNIPVDGKLDIVVPTDGCTICLQTDLGGQGKYDLSANKTIDLKGHASGTFLYSIQPLNDPCPARPTRDAHTIKIGSGV